MLIAMEKKICPRSQDCNVSILTKQITFYDLMGLLVVLGWKWISNSKEAKAMDTGIIDNLVKDFSNSRC